MGAIVTFDPVGFQTAFPEFATVPVARLDVLFTLAEGLLDNTGAGPVNDANQLQVYFQLLVAHLLTLFGPSVTTGGQGGGVAGSPNAPVGRLDSATEGTVTTSFDYGTIINPSEAWYVQTKYGALYWTMTARYRSFHYVARGDSGTGYAKDFLHRAPRRPGGI
jgi:hypothetical protein